MSPLSTGEEVGVIGRCLIHATLLIGMLFNHAFAAPPGRSSSARARPNLEVNAQGSDDGFASPGQPAAIDSSLADRVKRSALDSVGTSDNRNSELLPPPPLDRVALRLSAGRYSLGAIPPLEKNFLDRKASIDQRGNYVFYTVDAALQDFATQLIQQSRVPHVAIVAMDPASGKILAIGGRSSTIREIALHSDFPAASLFKVVTTAAGLETERINADSPVFFRGGTYDLGPWNYLPDRRRDRRFLTVADALGKSCNPVFGRIALMLPGASSLARYAAAFGFHSDLGFDLPLTVSSAVIPSDAYELSRTGAGFGAVTISPIHAAAIAAGLAHNGMMPRPYLIERVVSTLGTVQYEAKPELLRRMMAPETAIRLLSMMETTTTTGTSRHAFMPGNRPILGANRIAGKTGTLNGMNPEGVTNWFIGAGPIGDPKLAVAVVVVNPGSVSTKASHIGRLLFQKFLGIDVSEPSLARTAKTRKPARTGSLKRSKAKNSKAVVKKKAAVKKRAVRKR